MGTVRLQKYLADSGVASRRASEKLITAGKVMVNNLVVTELGTKVDPARDEVRVNGKKVKPQEEKIYLKLNKPCGVVSACSDPHETTVIDLIKKLPYRIFPIGRLDKDSEGLVLLTNDGELANKLMHPKYEHEKEYLVNVQSPMAEAQCQRLRAGVVIDNKKTLPAIVVKLASKKFRITLREGRNRQIRNMVDVIGNKVVALKRIRIGSIKLGKLVSGQYEPLTSFELRNLSC